MQGELDKISQKLNKDIKDIQELEPDKEKQNLSIEYLMSEAEKKRQVLQAKAKTEIEAAGPSTGLESMVHNYLNEYLQAMTVRDFQKGITGDILGTQGKPGILSIIDQAFLDPQKQQEYKVALGKHIAKKIGIDPAVAENISQTYIPTGVLGKGAMGRVYEVVQSILERPEALKILSDPSLDQKKITKFEKELVTMSMGSSESLEGLPATYIAGDTKKGQTWVAYELIRGQELRKQIHKGPLPAEQALAITRTVAEVLQFYHERNIVHRDIKPENILLTKDGKPKLIDFGIATDSEKDLNGLMGGIVASMNAEVREKDSTGQEKSRTVTGPVAVKLLYKRAKEEFKKYAKKHSPRFGRIRGKSFTESDYEDQQPEQYEQLKRLELIKSWMESRGKEESQRRATSRTISDRLPSVMKEEATGGYTIGTPQYLSPEQAMGFKSISVKSDMFSLGAVLYEMLSGTAPYAGDNPMGLMINIINENPAGLNALRKKKKLPPLPIELIGLVQKLMSKDPKDRLSADELIEQLDKIEKKLSKSK